jgi:hypothetical protein
VSENLSVGGFSLTFTPSLFLISRDIMICCSTQ